MGRVSSLRSANSDLWHAATHHKFVQELLQGTIKDEVLRHYLVQDYHFCDPFLALVAQACASAPNLQDRLVYSKQLGFIANDENTYFVDTFDELHVSQEDRVSPKLTQATRNFDQIMHEAIESRSYGACLAVLYVGEGLYLDWANQAASNYAQLLEPKHSGWVDVHRGEDFSRWVSWLGDSLDSLVLDDSEEKLITDLFNRSVACEKAFFDAAYEV